MESENEKQKDRGSGSNFYVLIIVSEKLHRCHAQRPDSSVSCCELSHHVEETCCFCSQRQNVNDARVDAKYKNEECYPDSLLTVPHSHTRVR